MVDLASILKTSDVAPGTMKSVVVGGKPIAIANIDGNYFAVSDTCTHEECSLGNEGFLDGNLITCGCHGSVFDATNGKVLSLPATVDLQTYPVKIEGENILIEL